MKRLVVLAALIALLGVCLLSNSTGTSTSIADTSILDNETANPGSANATITITWTTASPPDE